VTASGVSLNRDDRDDRAAVVVAELERAGYTANDRVQLRFSFGVPALRVAADLATTLRMGGHTRVQVRPVATRLLRTHRWRVIATTHPAPIVHAVIRLWEEQMEDTARSHPGCTVLAWEPIATRILSG
jgi:hypothetical protein